MVQWTIRKENTELGESRRERFCEGEVRPFRDQYDRAGRINYAASFCRRRFDGLSDGGEPVFSVEWKHDGEWFVRPALALAETPDSFIIAGIAHQVIAADTLDRDDRAAPDGERQIVHRATRPFRLSE